VISSIGYDNAMGQTYLNSLLFFFFNSKKNVLNIYLFILLQFVTICIFLVSLF